VQQRDGLLDHPTVGAQAAAVCFAAAGDLWGDPFVADEVVVLVVVVAAVCVEH
jgi:hypothetical protein